MHPVTGWYLVQAKQDELMRNLARPRVPRAERPERHGLLERIGSYRHRRRTSGPIAASAGCSLPMGCAV
jgi:hypothetical protein